MNSATHCRKALSATAVAVGLICASAGGGVHAATVSPEELNVMMTEAQKNGLVAVSVHLAPVSLDDMHTDLKGAQKMVAKKAAKLLAELGTSVSTSGRWDNTVGQIGLHVNAEGLAKLQNSNNAISFSKDAAWHERSALDASDGSLAAIEAQLAQNGYADVQVTFSSDDLEHTTQKDGSITYHSAQGKNDDVKQKAKNFQGKLASPSSAKILKQPDSTAVFDPHVTMRLTREGVLALAEDETVRKIAPVGFTDARPAMLDPEALTSAERDGSATVLITVRNPLAGGKHNPNSFGSMKRSNKRTSDGIFSDNGIKSPITGDYSEFGVVSAHLTKQELKALYASKDARVLGVELNKPVAQPALNISTATMNMASAWNKNLRAAGQNIVIMDSGVQSNHPFFRNAAGNSRVVFEACFGTNSGNFVSPCPNQNATGDSPLGLAGSAAPIVGVAGGTAVSADDTNHGTHVAGIAAGRSNTAVGNGLLQGVAPDASIIAVQVFSRNNATGQVGIFNEDILAGLSAVVASTTANTQNNPITINMSFADRVTQYTGSCSTPTPPGSFAITTKMAISTAITTLFNAGVPIVAATGNNGWRGAIAWPSCEVGVIKVGSTNNDGVGATISGFTNVPNIANFPAATNAVWMVPGGSVTSSTPGNSIGLYSGTSQAAPHVAGLYAAIKAGIPGISVDGATAWIRSNAAQPLAPVSACNGAVPCVQSTYSRIRLPN